MYKYLSTCVQTGDKIVSQLNSNTHLSRLKNMVRNKSSAECLHLVTSVFLYLIRDTYKKVISALTYLKM